MLLAIVNQYSIYLFLSTFNMTHYKTYNYRPQKAKVQLLWMASIL